MENNSSNPNEPQTGNSNQPAGTTQPTQPANLTHGDRVIQPINDMSEYANNQPVQKTQPSPPPNQTTNSPGAPKPLNTSNIYPNVTTDTAQAPTPPINNPNPSNKSEDTQNQRVSERVPLLKVYAFVLIIYGLYSSIYPLIIFSYITSSRSLGRSNAYSPYTALSPIFIFLIGFALFNIAVAIYLLTAKNIKTVGALLTALLIVSGLGLINSLITTMRYISSIGPSSIVSLLISIGLFMFLLNVRSAVDLAAMDRH